MDGRASSTCLWVGCEIQKYMQLSRVARLPNIIKTRLGRKLVNVPSQAFWFCLPGQMGATQMIVTEKRGSISFHTATCLAGGIHYPEAQRTVAFVQYARTENVSMTLYI